MTSLKTHPWLVIAIGSYLVIASGYVFAQATDDLVKMSQDANQWVIPLGDYSGTRHSSLNQINAQNAWKLKVAWTMSTGALRGHEGQPLVVGKMMYFESAYPNYVYAIDLDSYWHMVWKFTPQQDKLAPSVACCDLVNRGLAYANGKILMSSRMHGSEEALATLACRHARAEEEPCVLVGGLGMGFTLRAALDLLSRNSTVVLARRTISGGTEMPATWTGWLGSIWLTSGSIFRLIREPFSTVGVNANPTP